MVGVMDEAFLSMTKLRQSLRSHYYTQSEFKEVYCLAERPVLSNEK